MGHPRIAAFARLADGSAAPTRKIEGQKTLFNRTMHSIAYDEIHDEIIVPHPIAQAILIFDGGANGEAPPIRIIQGAKTQLRDSERLALDPVHDEIFVPSQDDTVLVFDRKAQGDVAPIRVLKGPDTMLGASTVAVDPIRNLLIVGGGGGRNGPRLLIFNRTDQGNTKPKAVIGGPKSGLVGISGPITVYPKTGKILVNVRGEAGALASDEAFTGVWSVEDQGDVPPRWKIGGPNGMLRQPRGLAVDPKHQTIIISDKYLNAVLTYHFPEIF